MDKYADKCTDKVIARLHTLKVDFLQCHIKPCVRSIRTDTGTGTDVLVLKDLMYTCTLCSLLFRGMRKYDCNKHNTTQSHTVPLS